MHRLTRYVDRKESYIKDIFIVQIITPIPVEGEVNAVFHYDNLSI